MLLPPILLVALSFRWISHGQPVEDDRPIPEWAKNRIFSISTEGPMAAYFENNKKDKQFLSTLTKEFKEREADMSNLHRTADYAFDGQYKLCNVIQEKSIEAVAAKIKTLNFGTFKSNCITQMTTKFKYPLFEAMMQYAVAVRNAGMAATRATVKWSHVYSHSNFTYQGPVHRCEFAHTAGFRVQGKWGIMSSVTEFPINLWKSEYGRQYLVEFLHTDPNMSVPVSNLLLTLPKWGDNTTIIPTTTTSIETWRGIPAASIFREIMPLEENPAVQAALTKGRRWKEQALDSTTKSNISIMMLSAALTLLPIALFADVSWVMTFAYALITDIVSCLPLAIKGIELIDLSKITQDASVSWVYGMETTRDIGVVETWCARCSSHNSLRRSGIVFLCLSIAAIVVGLILDVLARKRLQSRKEKYNRLRLNINPEFIGQMWTKIDVCADCRCRSSFRNTGYNILHAKFKTLGV